MGLDSVELILRTEEEFSISITDEEAGRVRTVGDFYSLVLSKLDVTPDCLSSRAFYRTRSALTESLKVPRRSIRPSTNLESLLPQDTRIRDWRTFGVELGLECPRLRHGKDWSRSITVFCMLVTGLPITFGMMIMYRSIGLAFTSLNFLLVLPALLLWVLAFSSLAQFVKRATPMLAYTIPFKTAGELAQSVLAMNFAAFQSHVTAQPAMTKDLAWKKLVDIFCDQLQIDPEEVVPSARIVQDLGVD